MSEKAQIDVVQGKKTLEEKLAELNADRASEALVDAILNKELLAAIDEVVSPVLGKFHEEHPFISAGFEVKVEISDGSPLVAFTGSSGSMKGHRKRVKAIRNYRDVLEKAVAKAKAA